MHKEVTQECVALEGKDKGLWQKKKRQTWYHCKDIYIK